MKSCHFAPGFIFWSASVQPVMTPFTGKVAVPPCCLGSVELRAVDERATIFHGDVSVALGEGPLPSLITLYCKPVGQRLDAGLGLVGRQERRAVLLVLIRRGGVSPGLRRACAACCLARILLLKSVSTSLT